MERCSAPLAGDHTTVRALPLCASCQVRDKERNDPGQHHLMVAVHRLCGDKAVCLSVCLAVASTVSLSQHQQLSFPEKTLFLQEHQCTLLTALPVQLLIQAMS